MSASMERTVTLWIHGPLERRDLAGLFARSCALLGGRPEVLRCELVGVAADAVAVDALARLALTAQRGGCSVRLAGASRELVELVAFMGLADVLRCQAPAGDGRA